MGQLEKYGLYVLCLVIFLILGVTIWGGGDVPQKSPAASIRAPGAPAAVPPPAVGGTPVRTLAETLLGGAANEPSRGSPVAGTGSSKTAGLLDATSERNGPNDPPKTDPKAAPKVEPKVDPKPEPKVVTYKVQEGDTYGSLARTRLGKESLWTEIQKLNPAIKPEKLRAGTEIQLPTSAAVAAEAKAQKGLDKPLVPAPAGGRGYLVKKGDSFARIAKVELGSDKRVNELMELNPSVAPEKLKPGMTLQLPKK